MMQLISLTPAPIRAFAETETLGPICSLLTAQVSNTYGLVEPNLSTKLLKTDKLKKAYNYCHWSIQH